MSRIRILVFGGGGMLGHRLVRHLDASGHEVWATFRAAAPSEGFDILDPARCITGVEATDHGSFAEAVAKVSPDLIVNAVGIIKQRHSSGDEARMIAVNSLFPHRLRAEAERAGARLISFSTDCVFSGSRGRYRESDVPDADDLYGRSKLLGEVLGDDVLTIRTSMIGREMGSANGLLEWFLKNAGGRVSGYRKAFFSGLTTLELSRVVGDVIIPDKYLNGLYHIAGPRISKLDLLTLIDRRMGLGTEIAPTDDPELDRSLDQSRFRKRTGYAPPSWDSMIEELAEDPAPYKKWKTKTS